MFSLRIQSSKGKLLVFNLISTISGLFISLFLSDLNSYLVSCTFNLKIYLWIALKCISIYSMLLFHLLKISASTLSTILLDIKPELQFWLWGYPLGILSSFALYCLMKSDLSSAPIFLRDGIFFSMEMLVRKFSVDIQRYEHALPSCASLCVYPVEGLWSIYGMLH